MNELPFLDRSCTNAFLGFSLRLLCVGATPGVQETLPTIHKSLHCVAEDQAKSEGPDYSHSEVQAESACYNVSHVMPDEGNLSGTENIELRR